MNQQGADSKTAPIYAWEYGLIVEGIKNNQSRSIRDTT